MPRLILTGTFATYMKESLSLRRQGKIDAEEYAWRKRLVIQQQKRANEREREEAEQRARQAAFLAKEAARKAARAAKRQAEIRRDVLFDELVGDEPYTFLVRLWKAIRNVIGARVFINGEEYDVPLEFRSSSDFIKRWFEDYETQELIIESGQRIVAIKPSSISAEKLEQMFRDGVEHCVFRPIKKRIESIIEEADSGRTKSRWRHRLAKMCEMENLYSKGVPVEKMEEVAKEAGLGIVIQNIVGNKILSWNQAIQRESLNFVNTRPNHVDIGRIVLNDNSMEISEERISDIRKELDEKGEWYMTMGTFKKTVCLHTITTTYRVISKDKPFFDDMDALVGIQRMRFNASRYPEVNEFIKSGTIVNSWPTNVAGGDATGHIDMPKAYTQFKNCKWYNGFLGVIQQWATGSFDRQWLETHIGMYRARILSVPDNMLRILGIVEGNTITLPSVELLYFMDYGVQMDVYDGVWGARMDFEFPDYMMKNKRYSIWSGRLGMEHNERFYHFKCDEDWARHLASDVGSENCRYYKDLGVCSISVPKKSVYTLHHIFAFITSYTRMNMMEAMRKFKLENISRVVCDGIYFRGECARGLDWPTKPMIEHKTILDTWYANSYDAVLWPEVQCASNTLLTGQGGCGKTHRTMTHPGYNNILYVVPEHILGQAVRTKFGVNYTTIHKLIGEGCRPYKDEYPYPPVMFVDELTQLPAEWVDRAMKMYPDTLIIMAGDVEGKQWFQTLSGAPGAFSKVWSGDIHTVHIPGDRRSRDDELRALKLRIRDWMRQVFIDGESSEQIILAAQIKKMLPCIPFEEAVKMFKSGDTWIAGTHKTNEKLLAAGVVSGYYMPGGHISVVELPGYKKRGSFTIHSYQGQTIETGKIFITVSDLFEYAMFYTAVSRAVNYSQLVFVK